MNEIWRKLNVSILESPAFSNPELLKVYIYCLSRTAFKTSFVSLPKGRGNTTVTIQAGQMLWGRIKAAERLKFSPSKCERHLKQLEKFGMILRQPHKNFTVVSVVELIECEEVKKNSEPQMNFKRTSNELQMNTYKSIKSINIEENKGNAPKIENEKTDDPPASAFGSKISLNHRVREIFQQRQIIVLDSDLPLCGKIAYKMRDSLKQINKNNLRPNDDLIIKALAAMFDKLPEWIKEKGFFSPSGIHSQFSTIFNQLRNKPAETPKVKLSNKYFNLPNNPKDGKE